MTLLRNPLVYLLLLIVSCSDKKNDDEKTVVVMPAPDTMSPVKMSDHKPDSTIGLKDDYYQLTPEELEREDQTHLDISYFPSNYASDIAFKKASKLKIRIIYSRPHKRGRPQIFGNEKIVPYGILWRLGANESSEIEFLTPVEIGGKKLKPGRYSIYAIPYPEKWTFIVNSNLYTWGDFNYDSKKDLVRTDILVGTPPRLLETFLIYFQKTATGANMIMAWDNVQATLPVKIAD
jgi:hypothetical protein